MLIAWLTVFSLILPLASCGERVTAQPPKTRQYYEYFNTVSVVYSYRGDTDAEFAAACSTVEGVLGRLHRLYDIYYEYSGTNNLATVNRLAGREAVEVDAEIIDLLEYAKEIYTLTGGRTNVMLGAVTRLWHDCREEARDYPDRARVPDADELRAAAEHVSIDSLVIDREAGTVYISDPEASLDVGALGKGYATELAAQALRELGLDSYVLNIGGNLAAIGRKPNGDGWRTSIRDPHEAGGYSATVELADSSLVTSGDYERYYTVGGVRYHHLIDPATLMPARYFSSVSVLCRDSALADALSTALFCMPAEQGRELVRSLEGVEAYWITPEGDEYMTEGFRLVQLGE